MSSHSFRVVIIILVVSAMTTCLSLYLSTSSRKFATEFGSRSHPQKRLRHTFEAIKNSKADIPNVDFRLVIHGGAGVISKEIDSKPFFDSLTRIMTEAYRFAKEGRNISGNKTISALDLVEYTVRLLENDPLFNAGRGAVFTADGTHEMEASIMDGSNLKCGAVSLVKTVRNPISLARIVMDKTTHNYIVGEAAEQLAVRESLAREDPAYFSTEKRREQLVKAKQAGRIVNDHDLEDRKNLDPLSFQNHPSDNSTEKVLGSMQTERISIADSGPVPVDSVAVDVDSFNTENTPISVGNTDLVIEEKYLEVDFPGSTGTVGCVCMLGGHVAAATSTGGLTNKMAGRIGDTPIIGAGTYANDETCAVSATGKGEEFMRHVAAYDVSARVEIGKLTLSAAVEETVFKKLPVGSGGLIAVNALGEYSMEFNSKGMFRGVCDSHGECSVGIWEDMVPIKVVPETIIQAIPEVTVTAQIDSESSVESRVTEGL